MSKFCTRCGGSNPDDAAVCESCKNPFGDDIPSADNSTTPLEVATPKKASTGLIILTIFFPIIGLPLYFMKKEEGGKTYLKIFLIETIIATILSIIAVGLAGVMMKNGSNQPKIPSGDTSIVDGVNPLGGDEETTAVVDNDSPYYYYSEGTDYSMIPPID